LTTASLQPNAGGKALVQSKGDVVLGYNTDTDQRNWTTSHSSGNIIKSKTTTTNHTTVDKTAEVTQINAGQVQVLGNNVTSYGANLNGQSLVQVEGAGKTALYAVNEEHLNKADSKTSSSLFGINYSKSTSSDSNLNTTALGTKLTSEEAIKLGVGTVTDVRGAIMTAPKIDIVRSEGADTSKPGELILGTSTNTTETSHTESTTTAGVWKAESGHGSTTETANQTQINGQLNIANGINTTVQIPEGNLKDQVAALSQQPGMGYLNDLANDPKIKWSEVKLAHDQWQYDQQGLTPAGAALLSIAIAVYTGGMGAELLGTTTTAAGAAVNAGFSALAASAAVSFVNNGGDIGKTLKDLGSKDSIKNIALAMVTAGVLSELNTAMGLDKVTVKDGFTANLNKAVINNLANAGVTSVLTGTSLEDNIKTGLVSALISAGSGQAANTIGDLTQDSQALKALAHALAGCMAGGASGGKQGCESGAIGAVVGELAAQWYDPNGTKPPQDTLDFVKVVSAAAGAITGDGSAASVSTAVMTGVNAAQNNYLKHTQVALLADKLKACGGDANCKNNAMDEAYRQSSANDVALLNCKATNNCEQLKAEYRQGMQAIVNLMDSGLPSSDVARVLNLENTAQTIIRYGLDQKTCVTTSCKENASYLAGVGQGLAKITPAGLAVGTGVMAYELTMALVNNGAVDTAVKLAQGMQDLPASIRAGLNSSDPAVRGEALVDALSLGAAGAALATKFTTTAIATATPTVIAALDKSATNALMKTGGAVDAQGNALLDMSTLTNAQKGVMGDLFGANTVKQIVPDGQKIARVPGIGEQGLDDLYKVKRPDVDYVNIEYKFVGQDNKTGAQVLKNTNDGKQGSESWIAGSNRIQNAVGLEAASDVYKSIDAGRIESWVVTTRPDGSTSIQVLDALGKPKPIDTSKIILPGVNLSGAKP
jgi:hypothetical protein